VSSPSTQPGTLAARWHEQNLPDRKRVLRQSSDLLKEEFCRWVQNALRRDKDLPDDEKAYEALQFMVQQRNHYALAPALMPPFLSDAETFALSTYSERKALYTQLGLSANIQKQLETYVHAHAQPLPQPRRPARPALPRVLDEDDLPKPSLSQLAGELLKRAGLPTESGDHGGLERESDQRALAALRCWGRGQMLLDESQRTDIANLLRSRNVDVAAIDHFLEAATQANTFKMAR
jgi:hypothetical protein